MHSFISFISWCICSGGSEATAREMDSGASFGTVGSPYLPSSLTNACDLGVAVSVGAWFGGPRWAGVG